MGSPPAPPAPPTPNDRRCDVQTEIFDAYKAQANAEIARLRGDVAALAGQKKELELENRRLWAAAGHLRQAYGVLWGHAEDCTHEVEVAEGEAAKADALLGGLVPLAPAPAPAPPVPPGQPQCR